ncbi:MAG: four helix bundle protein [Thermoanaerobaculia bacterium]
MTKESHGMDELTGDRKIQANAPEKPRDIYERSFEFACRIVKLYQYMSTTKAPRTLAAQLLRSGTSLGANLEEAHAAQSRADFISKCRIALKEARESHYWLRLFAATGIVASRRIAEILQESNELVAILTSIVRTTSQRKNAQSSV